MKTRAHAWSRCCQAVSTKSEHLGIRFKCVQVQPSCQRQARHCQDGLDGFYLVVHLPHAALSLPFITSILQIPVRLSLNTFFSIAFLLAMETIELLLSCYVVHTALDHHFIH